MGYHSLADSMRPIELIIDRPLTTHSLGQISTPLTSYVMSDPNLPRSFASGAQPSIPMSSVPLNDGGNPRHDLCYLIPELYLVKSRPLK